MIKIKNVFKILLILCLFAQQVYACFTDCCGKKSSADLANLLTICKVIHYTSLLDESYVPIEYFKEATKLLKSEKIESFDLKE